RRLFYWTARFFPESAARGFALAGAAVQRALPNVKSIAVNWNNWISRWYFASPNQPIGYLSEISPDNALESPDWFASAPLNAHTPGTEDWLGDQEAQTWSVYGDALRSVSMLSGQEFGGYVVGRMLGAHAAGASYKILSLLGHGAKTVDLYTFGPRPLVPSD